MAKEPCDEQHLQLLSRTASNAYFAQKVSALAIPEKGRELQKAVGSPRLWNQLKKATEPSKVSMARELFDDINLALSEITGKAASEFSNEEIAAVVKRIHGGEGDAREGLRTAEFKEFLSAKPEVPGEVPPQDDDFFASKLVMTKAPHPTIVDITLVKKLRGVTAQVGFTRLGAPVADLQGGYSEKLKLAALTMNQEWLPATETFGEGVLLRFDEERMRQWEEHPQVLERAKGLFDAYLLHYGDKADRSLFPGFATSCCTRFHTC
jgi:hypothetical protein